MSCCFCCRQVVVVLAAKQGRIHRRWMVKRSALIVVVVDVLLPGMFGRLPFGPTCAGLDGTNAAAGGPSQQQQRRSSSSIPSLQTGVFAAPSRVAPRWLWLGASIRDAPGRPPSLLHRRTTWSLGLATNAGAVQLKQVASPRVVDSFSFLDESKCWLL